MATSTSSVDAPLSDLRSDLRNDLRSSPDATCSEQILAVLRTGEKPKSAILGAVPYSKYYTSRELTKLVRAGKIARVKKGVYKLNEVLPSVRFEDQNAATINRLLNLYDMVLEKYSDLIEEILADEMTNLEEKAGLLNNFKALASMVDSLMKRWYLVHRGYDSNTRQAQEDAKAKAKAIEQAEFENAPPEDRVIEVGHYHEDMRELWDTLPNSEKAKPAD